MLHIYTGNGKGKTTCATGLAVRALGASLRVFFAQFIKDGSSSEILFLRTHGGENFTYFCRGRGKFITGDPAPEDKSLAQETLRELKKALVSGNYDMVTADELLGAMHGKLLSEEEVRDFLREVRQHPEVEVILTGRNAPDFLKEEAGLVSDIACVKHYYTQNRPPKKGVEF